MRSDRLPKRVPVGTKYVIEGKTLGDSDEMRIFSRYLVYPDGRCVDLPPDLEVFALRAPTSRSFATH
ncbi:MAG TPA: hypothetical protein VFA53_08835 [Xanthobacteraceae bacterium]|nr:hypothetical protein [Xanthobacteraceae bacterium]